MTRRRRILNPLALLTLWACLGGCAIATEWSDKYNQFQPIRGERDSVIRSFDFYSQLQRNFEEAHYDARSRDLIENYTSGIVLPSCAAIRHHFSARLQLRAKAGRLIVCTDETAACPFWLSRAHDIAH